MFLKYEDLGSTMYGFQIHQITEGDSDIVDIALAAAEEEIRSYLTGNNRKEWLDGRIQYDVEAILSKIGLERNQLIVKQGITIAKYWLIDLSNADMIYEQAKERYDRSTEWLTKLANGELTLSTLPTLADTNDEGKTKQAFSFGSRKKFNHE
jgi:phage gp36-like protein